MLLLCSRRKKKGPISHYKERKENNKSNTNENNMHDIQKM